MVLSNRSSLWSSPMVEVSDHLFPISKADMWSLWVGKCLHTLVTCIAQPKSDPWRGRYLAKFRSHGIWNIWRVWGNEVDGFLLGFIWTPWFATLLGTESGLLFFLEKILHSPCWYNLNSLESWLGSSLWDEMRYLDCDCGGVYLASMDANIRNGWLTGQIFLG